MLSRLTYLAIIVVAALLLGCGADSPSASEDTDESEAPVVEGQSEVLAGLGTKLWQRGFDVTEIPTADLPSVQALVGRKRLSDEVSPQEEVVPISVELQRSPVDVTIRR